MAKKPTPKLPEYKDPSLVKLGVFVRPEIRAALNLRASRETTRQNKKITMGTVMIEMLERELAIELKMMTAADRATKKR